MASTKLTQSAIRVVITALGPRRGRAVVSQIDTWLTNSGAEWTSKRLKAIWTAAKQCRAGNHSVVKDIFRENGIAWKGRTPIPKGVFGYPFYVFVSAARPSVIRRMSAVLRVYTDIRLTELSKTQVDKARESINSPLLCKQEDLSYGLDLVESWARKVFPYPDVKRPDLRRLKPFTSTHVDGKVPEHLRDLPYGRAAMSFATMPMPYEISAHPQIDETWSQDALLEITNTAWPREPGHISFIQEAGCKARVVAVPTAWYQWFFEPLHSALDRLASRLPASCVHDQSKGADFISANLGRKQLYCFDLSSATDRFPLQLQTRLLEVLNLGAYVEPLERATQKWVVESNSSIDQDEEWTYQTGQPMGLYGSFPLFHLTHYAIIDQLRNELAISGTPSESFSVLGDDVIIADGKLAEAYRDTMRRLGIPINPQKSIISSEVAEFAGFVGVITNRGIRVFRPYKYGKRDMSKPNSLRFGSATGLLYALGRTVQWFPGKTGEQLRSKYPEFLQSLKWRNQDLTPLLEVTPPVGRGAPRDISRDRLTSLLSAAIDAASSDSDWLLESGQDEYLVREMSYHLLGEKATSSHSWSEPVTPDKPEKQSTSNIVTSLESDPLLDQNTLDWLDEPIPEPLDSNDPPKEDKKRSDFSGGLEEFENFLGNQ